MFFVFMPNAKSLTPSLRAQHRLDEILPASETVTREVVDSHHGPGLLCGWKTTQTDLLRISSEGQRWSNRWQYSSMIGTWESHPVLPTIIRRQNTLPGPSVTLLDGQQWTIPLLRSWHESDPLPRWTNELPRLLGQSTETGELTVGDVIPKYTELFDRSIRIADSLLGGDAGQMQDTDAQQFAIDLLSVNHHVDTSVVIHLQLLHAGLCGEIIRAALDLQTLSAALKKTHH